MLAKRISGVTPVILQGSSVTPAGALWKEQPGLGAVLGDEPPKVGSELPPCRSCSALAPFRHQTPHTESIPVHFQPPPRNSHRFGASFCFFSPHLMMRVIKPPRSCQKEASRAAFTALPDGSKTPKSSEHSRVGKNNIYTPCASTPMAGTRTIQCRYDDSPELEPH